MCQMWKCAARPDDAPPEAFTRAALELQQLTRAPLQVNIMGGEPLETPGVPGMVRQLRKAGLDTILTTNGWLFTEETARLMAETGATLTLSVDSHRAGVHDWIRRRPGSHARCLSALETLRRITGGKGCYVTLLTTVMAQNLAELPDMVRWAAGLGTADDLYLMGITNPDLQADSPVSERWFDTGPFAELWPRETKTVRKVFDTLIEGRLSGRYGQTLSNSAAQLAAIQRHFLQPGTPLGFDPAYGLHFVFVEADGTVCLCGLPIGNVQTDPVGKIWTGPRAEAAREKIRAGAFHPEILLNTQQAYPSDPDGAPDCGCNHPAPPKPRGPFSALGRLFRFFKS